MAVEEKMAEGVFHEFTQGVFWLSVITRGIAGVSTIGLVEYSHSLQNQRDVLFNPQKGHHNAGFCLDRQPDQSSANLPQGTGAGLKK